MSETRSLAIVTGASSGIGADCARQLAARGLDVVLVARRADRLETLAAELTAKHAVTATCIALDLSSPDAPAALFDRTEGAGRPVEVLVNNAGLGYFQALVDLPWERTAEQLRLNVVALTELTYRFGVAMRRRGRGYILNVASIGAYQPVPHFATYAAGKAYVRDFTEAVAAELAPSGVRVCCLLPGSTATEFFDVSGQKLGWIARRTMMSAARCARIGLNALFGRRRTIVAGFLNSLGMWLMRFVPRRLMPVLSSFVLGKPPALPEGK